MRCWIQPRLIIGFAVAMCLPLNGCAVVDVPDAATHDFPLSHCQECQTPHSAAVNRDVLHESEFQPGFDYHDPAVACENYVDLSNFGEPAGFGADDCLWGRLKHARIPRMALPWPQAPLWRKAHEEIPEAPPFPRFHPLPVRPMFAPANPVFPAIPDGQITVITGYGVIE